MFFFRQVEPKIVDIDSEWLILFKGILHGLSMILLLVYAYVVWRNT